ncbi:MAG: hypothetical protein QHH04_02710 [Methanolinea sp.]|nr:hypothetical protein [Methanolinea sp.]
MTFSCTYQAAPAVRIGDRSFFLVSRRTAARWESGCTGSLTPVALVMLEDDTVLVYRLDPSIADRDVPRLIRDAFRPARGSQPFLPGVTVTEERG